MFKRRRNFYRNVWRGQMMSLVLMMLVGIGASSASAETRTAEHLRESPETLSGLTAPVDVAFDEHGVPTITARTRVDAMRALGYVTAHDRLFQMDWLRRASAGTLAEIVGQAALDSDIAQRVLGMSLIARSIVSHLPADQRAVLEAYAEGVNSFLKRNQSLPFEFHLLGYTPSPWTIEDTVLVTLGIFHPPSWMEDHERMVTIMKKTLPPEVFDFLTWDVDQYTRALLRERANGLLPEGVPPIPVQSLVALQQSFKRQHAEQKAMILRADRSQGSNGWVVAGSKTVDRRAILANDMHLPITIPNIWYRVQLRYGASELNGVILPGIPIVIIGTNGHVAWGFTDPYADLLDLVALDMSEGRPNEYRTPEGWRSFEERQEVISVKNGPNVPINVKTTKWGPVAQRPLMDRLVAIRWVAMDPQAVDFGLLRMDQALTMEEAIQVMNRARGPASSVLLADDQGRIAWTLMGRIPVRRDFTGFSSVSWADGSRGWSGYIPPEALPRIVDPPSGFLVSANHRMVGSEYPYLIGHDFDNGYRAYRITERLRELQKVREADMLELQLDTVSHFYKFYQQLALDVLPKLPTLRQSSLEGLRHTLEAWNGRADVDSVGFGLLVRFRSQLAEKVFVPFLSSCREQDNEFHYGVGDIETPLRQLLTSRIQSLVPNPDLHSTWDAFILSTLEESAKPLAEDEELSLPELTWGHLNRPRVHHILAQVIPDLSGFLDLPTEAVPGCERCVRVTSGAVGASQRLVVSPGYIQEGIFEMPGGQSGDPISTHYRDQHRAWLEGLPSPLLPGSMRSIWTLNPIGSP